MARFPYIARLRNEQGYLFCSATLIDPWFVLTAASCLDGRLPFCIGHPRVYIGGYSIMDDKEQGAEVPLDQRYFTFDRI